MLQLSSSPSTNRKDHGFNPSAGLCCVFSSDPAVTFFFLCQRKVKKFDKKHACEAAAYVQFFNFLVRLLFEDGIRHVPNLQDL